MIGVNVNGYEPAKLKEVMDREELNWRSFADRGDIVSQWNLPGTPTFYVIDHRGVIRHKWVGSPADYELGGLPNEEVIDEVLEALVAEAEASGSADPPRR